MGRVRLWLGIVLIGTLGGVVACGDDAPLGVSTGTVMLAVSTTGSDVDSDGYVISGQFGGDVTVATTDSRTLGNLPPGSYSFTVSGIAANCMLEGQNPRTVQVGAGQTVTVLIEITCSAVTGSARIVATTTGVASDPDGYTVSRNGEAPDVIGANAELTLQGLAPGEHTFMLADLAAGCRVSSANPQGTTVAVNETATVEFAVSCSPAAGSVIVSTNTMGASLDPDGYTLSTGAGTTLSIGTNGTATLQLAPGSQSITLSGEAANCSITSPNPATVIVPNGSAVTASFAVACFAVNDSIAFRSSSAGVDQIFLMAADGSGARQVTFGTGPNRLPDFAPGGTRLAYASFTGGVVDIWTINTDGTGAVNLTNTSGVSENRPAWSPSGSRIAFTSDAAGNDDIWLMDANGANAVQLTTDAGDDNAAQWSPDGSRIAWLSNRGGTTEVWVMNADGTNKSQLTTGGATSALDWSPDGSRIAFVSSRGGSADIWVIDVAGGALTQVTTHASVDDHPTWSPDGFRISFGSNRSGDFEVWVVDAVGGGSGLANLSNDPANDNLPDWSP